MIRLKNLTACNIYIHSLIEAKGHSDPKSEVLDEGLGFGNHCLEPPNFREFVVKSTQKIATSFDHTWRRNLSPEAKESDETAGSASISGTDCKGTPFDKEELKKGMPCIMIDCNIDLKKNLGVP